MKTYPKKFTVTDIEYDTDGQKIDLPTEMVINIPDHVGDTYEDIEQYIGDEISNRTGYCHFGFNTLPVIDIKRWF